MLAIKWEARAGKIMGYASSWGSMTGEGRNRSLYSATIWMGSRIVILIAARQR
jgi:hypothetical protein